MTPVFQAELHYLGDTELNPPEKIFVISVDLPSRTVLIQRADDSMEIHSMDDVDIKSKFRVQVQDFNMPIMLDPRKMKH